MFAASVGLTSARGSGSAFGYSVLPAAIWPAALSSVQPANGLGPGVARAVVTRL
ncbi:MAG TPA: hypothetical protein VGJ58_04780 [Gaiellaceae bacterium]